MAAAQFSLLRTRRFLPLFLTMALGALNDNIFKNALIVLATFHPAFQTAMPTAILAALAAGIFILPFFVFSATAGQLADKYEKSFLIRLLKISEMVIMVLAAIGFYYEYTWFLLGVLFLMGSQSAFFGPIKYSILPDHLSQDELVGGNALVEGATFLAILFGTIIGGLIVMGQGGLEMLPLLVIKVALLGFIFSRFIPAATPASPQLQVSLNVPRSTWQVMGYARENRTVFLSILGIAWFWLVGATFVSQFPPYVRDYIGGNEEVVTAFLAAFSIGVAVGSLLCGRFLAGEITARHTPLAMVGMAVFIALAAILTPGRQEVDTLIGVGAFFAAPHYIALFASLVMLAMCAGFVAVPLFALMQSRSAASHRARVISASNIMDALFMVVSSLLAILLLSAGASIPQLFGLIALLCLPVAWVLYSIRD